MEPVLNDPARVFDTLEAGGIRGLVVGRMVFEGSIPAFTPDPKIYQKFGVPPPPPPREVSCKKRTQLHRMLKDAKGRGWPIFIFESTHGMGPGGAGPLLVDPVSQNAYYARMLDTLGHFPDADGAIMDGPEWGYEIHPQHRSCIFEDLPDTLKPKAQELGYDYDAMIAARDRLHQRLHRLDRSRVRLHAPGGLLGAVSLFGADVDLMAWLRFRTEVMTGFFRGVRAAVAEADRPVQLGLGPRTAAFSPLCGYDFEAIAPIIDILLPKHYFWHRGFDGLYGTVWRYVLTLVEWNPTLTDGDALAVVKALCGLELPHIADRFDFESGFSPAFFDSVVAAETRRAIAAMGDPSRVIPWVDTGRRPHDGDAMTAADLRRILEASAGAGLQRFLYHNHGHLTDSEWTVISTLCGRSWRQLGREGYRPPDAAHLDP